MARSGRRMTSRTEGESVTCRRRPGVDTGLPGPCRRGFTLIEILLVVAILGVTTLISIPYLVRSIRGNRLRTATRVVVSAGKYARSMALLRQQDAELSFDLDKSLIGVRLTSRPGPPPSAAPAAPPPDTPRAEAEVRPESESDGTSPEPPVPTPARTSASAETAVGFTRALDDVRIQSVEVEDGDPMAAGGATVTYRSNGRCQPYTVVLADSQGNTAMITVDALSSPRTGRKD